MQSQVVPVIVIMHVNNSSYQFAWKMSSEPYSKIFSWTYQKWKSVNHQGHKVWRSSESNNQTSPISLRQSHPSSFNFYFRIRCDLYQQVHWKYRLGIYLQRPSFTLTIFSITNISNISASNWDEGSHRGHKVCVRADALSCAGVAFKWRYGVTIKYANWHTRWSYFISSIAIKRPNLAIGYIAYCQVSRWSDYILIIQHCDHHCILIIVTNQNFHHRLFGTHTRQADCIPAVLMISPGIKCNRCSHDMWF